MVSEAAAEGTAVGDPVIAHDPDTNDILTYSIDTAATASSTTDHTYFSIDWDTGQIRVAAGLDADSNQGRATGGNDSDAGTYVLVVRVTDSTEAVTAAGAGSTDTIRVTVTATGENEGPKVTGMAELMINENSNLAADNPATTDVTETDYNVYAASDVDAQRNINWHLEGDDAAAFRLSGTSTRSLTFREKPDFEMPTDANGDNVYKVTVVAADGDGGMGQQMVSVTVKDIDEPGKVTLSSPSDQPGQPHQPHIGIPTTAMLEDPDGDVTIISWQWAHSEDRSDFGADSDIVVATASTHTPSEATNGIGSYLRARVVYIDKHAPAAADGSAIPDDTDTAFADESKQKVVYATSTRAVQAPPRCVQRARVPRVGLREAGG